jgi:hypothetical protein
MDDNEPKAGAGGNRAAADEDAPDKKDAARSARNNKARRGRPSDDSLKPMLVRWLSHELDRTFTFCTRRTDEGDEDGAEFDVRTPLTLGPASTWADKHVI